jgi:hypothetical protein
LNDKIILGNEAPTVMIYWDGISVVGGWDEGRFETNELNDHLSNL